MKYFLANEDLYTALRHLACEHTDTCPPETPEQNADGMALLTLSDAAAEAEGLQLMLSRAPQISLGDFVPYIHLPAPSNSRFFRTADEAVYEQIRLGLDAAWGHQPPVTCFDPAAIAPRDDQNRILLAVRAEFADYLAVAEMLPGLLVSGAVEEIDAATYMAAQPSMA